MRHSSWLISGTPAGTGGLAAGVGDKLSAWSKQQQATIEALQPVAERIGKNLISEIPDLTSLSAADSYSWLSAIDPGAHITLPGK